MHVLQLYFIDLWECKSYLIYNLQDPGGTWFSIWFGKHVSKLGFTVFRILLYHTEWEEWTANLGRFSFVRSDQSVLKWNARVLRTGSGQNVPTRESEPLSSPAPVGQSAGIWRVVAGKMYARALDLSI